MKILRNIIIIFIMIFIIFSCKKDSTVQKEDSDYIFTIPYSKEKLPDDLIWLTNDTDPEFASPDAKKGGTLNISNYSYPLTFRVVGPDSNSGFRSYILDNQLSLINLHPNTENLVPELATHWAYGKDNKTMYFKLNKNAKWSDGRPITSQDFAYTIEFMRSKHIVAPWYNDFYTKDIDKVTVYDDYTLSVSATRVIPDLWYYVNIRPIARHFFGELEENFVEKYNWKIEPNTGPYQISEFQKGKFVIFKKKNDWWAKDLKYFKNRFNVDRIKISVVKDFNINWEYFKKGKVDTFWMPFPDYWHIKSNIDEFNNGYINKVMFYNDTRQGTYGMFMNEDKVIFKDKNLRYAFAHAMNVELVISKLLRNDYYRLEHETMGYGKYSNDNIRARRYDIKKVEEYMKKAGWTRGDDGIWKKGNIRFSVEVTYSQDNMTERLVVLKEEALKAGVELILDKLDAAAAYKKVIEKKHDVAWWAWSTSFTVDYWQCYHSDNAHKPQTNNLSNTDDPELDKLIDKHRYSINENERVFLAHKIQEKIHEICPFVPLFMTPFVRSAYWRWWKLPNVPGVKMNGDDLFYPFLGDYNFGGLFWYDENLHKETLSAMKKGIKFDPITIIDKTYMMEILKDKEKK